MPSRPARSLFVAIGVTVLAVVLMYLAATWGVAAFQQARAQSSAGATALPTAVESAPPSVGTTEQYGPLGALSMAYAGTNVEQGLLTDVEQPWLAVSARTGTYRAISAPDLPAPQAGAVAMSKAGDRLAWAADNSVQLYDPTTDETREVPVDGVSRVGAFSPDASMLTVYADGLAVLDLAGGDVVAEAGGLEPDVLDTTAWQADGAAVDYVDGRDLVTLPVDAGDATTQASPFQEPTSLAWSPSGEVLVALEPDAEDVPRLRAASAGRGGDLGSARTVDTSGISLNRLLGFSGEDTVAVSAYLLESGSLERILDVPLDSGSVVDMTTLPAEDGENWRDSTTLVVSGDALRAGSTDYGNRVWPWSYSARLGACLLVGLFGLGLWLTRRRRSRRR